MMAIHKGSFTRLIFAAFIFFPLKIGLCSPVQNNDGSLELIILHNNDMHARFEQTSVLSDKCSSADVASNNCYGGFARTAHEIRKYRQKASEPNGTQVLYLNAGDTYTGTPWFTIFQDNITAEFLNKLSPDAISLGNHEFDQGVEGLIPFLKKVNFPVLAANLDLSKEPELAAQKTLSKSTMFTMNGIKIGVIGYLTPETKYITNPNNVEYFPEVESINKEAELLKNRDDINIIIALGHSGYLMDQEIARNCPLVDIVIGGHTNTFLYNGKQPSVESPEGPYPKVITQKSGKQVIVVQAYAYTKYLGKLHVKFDKMGNLVKWDGQPILLNGTVPQDSDILELLELYRPKILELELSAVGSTKVTLEGGNICRQKECNLGNAITDAFIYSRAMEFKENLPNFWTDAAIALLQGGGIRSAITKKVEGTITRNDVLSVLPFQNDLYVTKVSGQVLLNALERSASKLTNTDSKGGFLQMSGVHVVYDVRKPIGERVLKVHVLCSSCDVPTYSELDLHQKYDIILTKFLLTGGDGYNWTESSNTKNSTSPIDTAIKMKFGEGEAFIEYLKVRSPIYPAEEGRIKIVGHQSKTNNAERRNVNLINIIGVSALTVLFSSMKLF